MKKSIEKELPKIIALFTKFGVKHAYLFGSAANNTSQKNSDVDFLYSFSENLDYETYASNYFELLHELENLLQKPVDLVAEKTLKNPYLIAAINESKIQLL